MTESVEVQLARFDERMKALLDHAEKSEATQNRQQIWMNNTDNTLNGISTRVRGVEDSLAKSAPTIEEFITIKHKVVGAGQLGKWLWGVGGILLGAVSALYAMRTQIITLMTAGVK